MKTEHVNIEEIVNDNRDTRQMKSAVLKYLRDICASGLDSNSKADANKDDFIAAFKVLNSIQDYELKRSSLSEFIEIVPHLHVFTNVFNSAVTSLLTIIEQSKPTAMAAKSMLLRISDSIPDMPELNDLYGTVMLAAINVSDKIRDDGIRNFSLGGISEKLRERGESLEPLSLLAVRAALGFAEKEGYRGYSLDLIAKKLPKICDYTFYHNQTFLGIARALPKRGEFLKVYKKAVVVAMEATHHINEPYAERYSLLFIARDLPKTDEYLELYQSALAKTIDIALTMDLPFAKQFTLLEVLQEVPKTKTFIPVIYRLVEACLPFYSMKSRMQDVEVLDVIDYIIVAEEKAIKESTKRKYIRHYYAKLFAAELDKFTDELNDVRIIELLNPYSHVWVRPVILRDTVKKVLDHFEELKGKYHGKEIVRPVFIGETIPELGTHSYEIKERVLAKDIIAIDLGATNTIIMRYTGTAEPEFITLERASTTLDGAVVVPTAIDLKTGAIGVETSEEARAVNIKKMMIEGSPNSEKLMEDYIKALYPRLQDATTEPGWFKLLKGRPPAERLTITVPVGYHAYRKKLEAITARTMKGMDVGFVEEPLAAAIGYQVAEERDKLVLVVDFGGCTLDIMLLRISVDETHVVAKPDRSKRLGGRDIDVWLADFLALKAAIQTTDDDSGHAPALIHAAERIKIELSQYASATFKWEGKEICDVTRQDFEGILEEHEFYKTLDRELSYVLKKSKKMGVSQEMIEAVLLTGGSSQIPSFKDKIAHTFPELRAKNTIYDHSPLTAVARGASLYGTKDVIDRHLGMAYALKFSLAAGGNRSLSYEIVFEKGEPLPFEKTFSIAPALTLGAQDVLYLEFFTVPEGLVTRRWVSDAGMEYIKQVLKHSEVEIALDSLKVVPLEFKNTLKKSEKVEVVFCVDEAGNLTLRYGAEGTEGGTQVNTDVRLQ